VTDSERLLGDDGPLARTLEGYESRAGQLAMARAVERALRDDRIVLCEAGTGTGKTLAYLVPALLSGKKVVVSTATRALQEQIETRDLPLIARHLGLSPNAAVMKGLSNYLCLRRFEEASKSPASLLESRSRALDIVRQWRETTESGDIASLAALPESDAIWRDVTSSSDTRVGPGCAFHDECFVTRMKRRAEAAQLVVVNHHLFFADLALRGPHPGHVIPDYDAVIFDEAHQLEDIATDFFGVRVSSSRLEAVLRDLERVTTLLHTSDAALGSGEGVIGSARSAATAFWQELSRSVELPKGSESRVAVERDIWAGDLARRWHELDSMLEGVAALAESTRGRLSQGSGRLPKSPGSLADALDVAARRTTELRDQLAIAIDGAPGRVTWLDAGAKSWVLSSSPVDVSQLFRDLVFERIPAVVLTSATLATGAPSSGGSSPFSYLRSRLGLTEGGLDVAEEVIASPFDFPNRALFYTPADLPEPGDPAFVAAAAERIAELVELSDGGAFVLTTSLRSMRKLAELLRAAQPERTVLLQGDAPKSALLETFREHGDAVLVATQSFWEGVDIPGRALRLVVLEKIPFAVPTDPIVRARSARIEEDGGNAFMSLHVPAAAIALKQGFGRLIRTKSDAGVVALLDSRALKKSYGRRLLAALPPARRTEAIDDVREFWQRMS
jgi:ATP-dependent DNA helicase DinG